MSKRTFSEQEERNIIEELAQSNYRDVSARIGMSRGWLHSLTQKYHELYTSLRHDKAKIRTATATLPPAIKEKCEGTVPLHEELDLGQPITPAEPNPTSSTPTEITPLPPPIQKAHKKPKKLVAVPDQPLDPPDQHNLQAVQVQLQETYSKLSEGYAAKSPIQPIPASPNNEPEEFVLVPGTKCFNDLVTKSPFRRKLTTIIDVGDTFHTVNNQRFQIVGWINYLNTPIGTLLINLAAEEHFTEIYDQYVSRRGVHGIDPMTWRFEPLENEAYKGTPLYNNPALQWGARIYKGMTGKLVGYWLAPANYLAPDRWINTRLPVQ